MLTYLTDSGTSEAEALCVGDQVEFRCREGGKEIEAWSAHGRRLGRLPPSEREAFATLLAYGGLLPTGRITALVPRPGYAGAGRIHIRVPAG